MEVKPGSAEYKDIMAFEALVKKNLKEDGKNATKFEPKKLDKDGAESTYFVDVGLGDCAQICLVDKVAGCDPEDCVGNRCMKSCGM